MKIEHRETKVSQNKGEIKEKESGFYSLLILCLLSSPSVVLQFSKLKNKNMLKTYSHQLKVYEIDLTWEELG